MQDNLDNLIKSVYKKWKSVHAPRPGTHPQEEDIACFIEGKLSPQESDKIKEHLISCAACTENIVIQSRLKPDENLQVPDKLIEFARNAASQDGEFLILEIFLKLKQKALELINTTGDVLVGQELMPAPLLRSRKIKDFKDEITILKDFQDLRLEIKIENKQGENITLAVTVREKQTSKAIKDLRVTLIKGDLELESYFSDSGKAAFEHMLPGTYTVAIWAAKGKIAQVMVDVRA
ncbi:MAG: zf-HC2 domain-containing protein [Deltaproteobacteria bacterium]